MGTTTETATSEDGHPGDLALGEEDIVNQEGPASNPELPLDTVFELIKNERRRIILDYLKESGQESVEIGELAEHIAAYENGIDRTELNAQQRKRVYIGLYQCHLPKMDDTKVVNFNKDRGWAELGPNAEQVFPYLETGGERSTELEYVHVMVAGLALAAALTFVVSRATGATLLMDVAMLGFIAGAGIIPFCEPYLRDRLDRLTTVTSR